MKYIVIFRKFSEAEDRQVLSIDSQESELQRIADRDGFVITKIFKESKSAKSSGRPVFNEMLAYIQKSGECVLLVWKPDRIARNMVDGGLTIELMDKGFIKEIRTPEKSFHNTSDDKFMMTLDFGIAKKYVDDLSVNVKRGNRAKLERGGWPNYAPFGYANDRLTKTIHPDEKIAPFIVRIFERYAQGGVSLQEMRTPCTPRACEPGAGKRSPKRSSIASSKTLFTWASCSTAGNIIRAIMHRSSRKNCTTRRTK